MKRKCRLAALLAAGLMLFCGCSSQADWDRTPEGDVNYLQVGMKLNRQMQSLAADSPSSPLADSSEEALELLEQYGEQEMEKPVLVVQLDGLEQAVPMGNGSPTGLWQDFMVQRAAGVFATTANSSDGGNIAAAASSLVSMDWSISAPGLEQPLYYLYLYGTNCACFVSILPGEDGTAFVQGQPMFGEELTELTTLEQVENWVNRMGFSGVTVLEAGG